jgi:hypothetical protein
MYVHEFLYNNNSRERKSTNSLAVDENHIGRWLFVLVSIVQKVNQERNSEMSEGPMRGWCGGTSKEKSNEEFLPSLSSTAVLSVREFIKITVDGPRKRHVD